ncbi:glycosyltransferase [uncultured Clostridium sp.]|mgnify:CR=1 FL=1|uniref:glycosyltransferase n=1 Tax=uncultured Clostridium sp. TaxID=59620 RepID=UPI0025DD2EE4|nr:glycosyltransferase [uncultured Clostridium sp.]
MNYFNILMLTPEFSQGGTESYILNVCEYLKMKDINVIVMSDGGVREEELEKLKIKHIKVDCLKVRNLKNLFRAILKVRSIMKLYNINIVHTSSIYTTIVAKVSSVLINKKVNVINTLHGGPNKNIEKIAAKILNVFSDSVIALSYRTKQKLLKYGLNKDKISVIYNGIKPMHELYIKKSKKFIIGTCGRLVEQKGYKYLIEAASKINIDDLEFWIIGDGELKNSLNKMVDNFKISDKVKFLGFRTDIELLLNEMDIFILPSLWEQFPISILEAMSLGKPIIATNVNGVPEELGNSGILVNPGNVSELVVAIEQLISDNTMRNKFGTLSKRRFYDNFTIEKMCNKLLQIYKNILSNNFNYSLFK